MTSITRSRSLIKAFTFRAIGTLTTVLLVYFFTRRLDLTVGMGVADTVVKLVCYYFHERIWAHIDFGKTTG